jgi:transglutaminase-like putative cysteine protease
MTIYAVRHVTDYRYRRPVSFGEHRLMFRPRDSYDQTLLGATLDIFPKPENIRWIHDVFGNCVAIVTFGAPAERLRFETNIRLDHSTMAPLDFEINDDARTFPFQYDKEEAPDLEPVRTRQFDDPKDELGQWTRQFLNVGRPTDTGHLLMTLCYAIKESFGYARRVGGGTQTPLRTLKLRRGTCRDFAVLMMEAARTLGLAARFVTGYIYVPDRDGSITRGGGSTHAWCQIYLPGSGWVEFDPTNGIVGNRELIRVGVARNSSQAIPLYGSFDGELDDCTDMSVQVNVVTESQDEISRTISEPMQAENV